MRLLLCLAEHAGEVVSIEDLLNQVWSGVFVNPDSVYQAVASLRRLLGDDPKQPTYIETVPRLGYRMVATVRPWPDPRSPKRMPGLSMCRKGPACASKLLTLGPPAGSFASRSSLPFCFTAESRTDITLLCPALLPSHRNPSLCCLFSTSPTT